jgi:hypothetical protein
MLRRTGIATLWFISLAFAGEVVWSLGLIPRPLGVIIAVALAGFVWLDPMAVFHARRDAERLMTRPAHLGAEAHLLSH